MEATIIWSGFGGRMSFMMTPTAAVCRISPLPLCHGPPTPSAISRPSFFGNDVLPCALLRRSRAVDVSKNPRCGMSKGTLA